MIEPRRATVFGVTIYFAICHDCRCWLTSSIGQFCWIQRHGRNRVVKEHKEFHEQRKAKAA